MHVRMHAPFQNPMAAPRQALPDGFQQQAYACLPRSELDNA